MTDREEAYAFAARVRVTEAAMALSRAGLPNETIREIMQDVAEHAIARAIAWGEEEDRRQLLADRDDFAEEFVADVDREFGCHR